MLELNSASLACQTLKNLNVSLCDSEPSVRQLNYCLQFYLAEVKQFLSEVREIKFKYYLHKYYAQSVKKEIRQLQKAHNCLKLYYEICNSPNFARDSRELQQWKRSFVLLYFRFQLYFYKCKKLSQNIVTPTRAGDANYHVH